MSRIRLLPLILALGACGGSPASPDAAPSDAAPSTDAHTTPPVCADPVLESGNGAITDLVGSAYGSRATSVIPTHFPTPYGTSAAPLLPVAQRTWGQFSNAVDDPAAPSPTEVAFAAGLFESRAQTGVSIVNHPDDLVVGSTLTQILVNVRFDHSLITVFLPPGWDPTQHVPIVMSGNPGATSNNARIFQLGNNAEGGSSNLKYGLNAAIAGKAGAPFIAVYSNVGGALSHGFHPDVLRDVGCQLAWIDQTLGGDRDKVVFVGKSRGGGAALTWGANPLDLDYTTVGVFAHVPIWRDSFIAERPLPFLIESLAPVASYFFTPAAMYEHNSPGAADVTAKLLDSLSPEGTVEGVRAIEPAALVAGLVDVPAISVCLGTHDPELPSSGDIDLLQQLEGRAIPHHAELTLRGTHTDCPGVANRFDAYLRYLVGLGPEPTITGTTWTLAPRIGEGDPSSPTMIPTGAALPWWGLLMPLVETSSQVEVHVCGPGGTVTVTGTLGDASVLMTETRALPAGCGIFNATSPASADTITWTITLPGSIDAAPHAIKAGTALATRVTTAQEPITSYQWDPIDTRLAGFLVAP